eukprot:COSAG02_NODE_45307_length_358_cov_0.984556_1_plen_38_part_01
MVARYAVRIRIRFEFYLSRDLTSLRTHGGLAGVLAVTK